MTFEELKLDDQLIEAIGYMGFKKASPIQEMAIPEILKGNDLLACAQTGTGKTGAFILPIIHKLATNGSSDGIDTLVICPTRELAIQIDEQIQGFSYFAGISSIAVYGGGQGDDWTQQKNAIKQGVDIVVATPGRLISFIANDAAAFKNLKHLILDEADRMLDMGFLPDISKILSYIPKKRQNLLFSATMAPKMKALAKDILNNPIEISLALSKPAEGVLQGAYLTFKEQKAPLIKKLIKENPKYKSIIVFTSTKKDVNSIVKALSGDGYSIVGVSSDLSQGEREEALLQFRSKQTRVMVATDVMSRGIDIKEINLVINISVPKNAEDYVHRIGRTARADSTGVALTMIDPDDMYNFNEIEKLIEKEVMKIPLPPEFGPGPEWKVRSQPSRNHGGNKKRWNKKKR